MSNLSITLLLLLWLIPIGVNIFVDRNGKKPNYLLVGIIRGMVAIGHGILFNPQDWGDYFPVFIFQITSYWLLFEIGLNLVRKRDIFYYDNKEGDSGWIDRFFKWAGEEAHLATKAVTFAVMIISIYFVYDVFGT